MVKGAGVLPDANVLPYSVLFSKSNKLFFGYFDPENTLSDNENKYFWGDLTDISAKKEALSIMSVVKN